MLNMQALSVKQLNLYVKSLIEGDVRLSNVTVTGEISNFKNHYQSGHFYFTLKDMVDLLGLEFNLVQLTLEDKKLFEEYNNAKKNKDFAKSDELRKIMMERKIL